MGFVYFLTSPSKKTYIGQTIRPIEERFKAHQKPSSGCVAIYNAIQYYGWENMKKEWYEVPDEDLNDFEEMLVALLGTLAPGGYNLREGGGNGKLSEIVRVKMSEAKIGEKNNRYGITHTNNTKQKMSEAKIGKTFTNEHRQNLSKAHIGKTLSDDTKKKLCDLRKGEKHHLYGKTHTKEAIKKMSEAHKGANNPISKKVYRYDIEGRYIDDFDSTGEATRSLGKNSNIISKCARGILNSAYGFRWSYDKYEKL
ncbi:GIY-YIG catalytic domain-containing endonuclease [Acanthocystis turfacea Chlorella virus NE-JV-3]|nr:GIY-YIG catalytic domain-containing endonuclease [Acanthocystis turfacea Chlorella virus NE-JV-3]